MRIVFGIISVLLLCLTLLHIISEFNSPNTSIELALNKETGDTPQSLVVLQKELQTPNSNSLDLQPLVAIKERANGRLDDFNLPSWTQFLNHFYNFKNLTSDQQNEMSFDFNQLARDLSNYTRLMRDYKEHKETIYNRRHYTLNFTYAFTDLLKVYQCRQFQYKNHPGCKLLKIFKDISPVLKEADIGKAISVLPSFNTLPEIYFTKKLAENSTFPTNLRINTIEKLIVAIHFSDLALLSQNNNQALNYLSSSACRLLAEPKLHFEQTNLLNKMLKFAKQSENNISPAIQSSSQAKQNNEYDNNEDELNETKKGYEQRITWINRIKLVHSIYSNNIANTKVSLSKLLTSYTRLEDHLNINESYLQCFNKNYRSHTLTETHKQYLISTFSQLENKKELSLYPLSRLLGELFAHISAQDYNLQPIISVLDRLKSKSNKEAQQQAYTWLQGLLEQQYNSESNLYFEQLDYVLLSKYFHFYELLIVPGYHHVYNQALITALLKNTEETLMTCQECYLSLIKRQNNDKPLTEALINQYKKIDKNSINEMFDSSIYRSDMSYAQTLFSHVDRSMYTDKQIANFQIKLDMANKQGLNIIEDISHYFDTFGVDDSISLTVKDCIASLKADLSEYDRRTGERLPEMPEDIKTAKLDLLQRLSAFPIRQNVYHPIR